MNGKNIRKSFLDFFNKNGHPVVESSSLIPQGDPSLLFTSAGMVPFKPYFLGLKTDLKRAASCQKSFRTTDIDRVGTTARHLTFFEMLGNFSFGDYFKAESIAWGWEYLTKEVGIDPTKLYVTIYGGGMAPEDTEAYEIWRKVLPANLREGRIKKMGDKDNFWTMGPTGPCGPCSEIYYDFGPEGNEHADCSGVGCDCDRYIEIWNHVFTQFDRQEDCSLKMLPRKNIDTGMGLERLAAVLQGKKASFDTDLFAPIAVRAAELLKTKSSQPEAKLALNIISDHTRASAFLISEGITPSNEGRGYVLRRIIRRSVRYGKLLGRKTPFMHELLPSVTSIFGDIYPGVQKEIPHIKETIKAEEERFFETLESGEKQIENLLSRFGGEIPGEEVFHLHETYGFPFELTKEIALKNGRTVDEKGFEAARTAAQETAKAKWKGSGQKETFSFQKAEQHFPPSAFTGYTTITGESEITGLLDASGNIVKTLPANTEGYVALNKTPFYAESGGQVGDKGTLIKSGKTAAEVLDTQKPVEKVILHSVKTKESIAVGDKLTAQVDKDTRQRTAANHTAIHLVNSALRQIFGDSVRQAGSYVSPERFRFDYTINSAPGIEQLKEIENIANNAVAQDLSVCKDEKPLAMAKELGAVTLVGEKYADPARFVLINAKGWADAKNRYSLELCGGTHVNSTGEVVVVKIIKDSSLSAGVRRIEGVAGRSAVAHLLKTSDIAEKTAQLLACPAEEIESRAQQILAREKTLRQEINQLNQKLLKGSGSAESKTVKVSDKVSLVWSNAGDSDVKFLRGVADKLRNSNKGAIVLATCVKENKMSFITCLTEDMQPSAISAADVAKQLAEKHGGKAGGRPDFAQGGGSVPGNWDEFVKTAAGIVKSLEK